MWAKSKCEPSERKNGASHVATENFRINYSDKEINISIIPKIINCAEFVTL